MSTLAIVLIVVAAVLLVLVAGGAIAVRRRNAHRLAHLQERAARADGELAAAYAADKGWERGALEAAARTAFAERHPGHEPEIVALVGVVDMPGTEEDRAVFEITAGGHGHRLTLARSGDTWSPT